MSNYAPDYPSRHHQQLAEAMYEKGWRVVSMDAEKITFLDKSSKPVTLRVET